MDDKQILRLLAASIREAGGLRKWAMQHKLSPGYVSHVMHRRRRPADSILTGLGLVRRVTIEPAQARRRA